MSPSKVSMSNGKLTHYSFKQNETAVQIKVCGYYTNIKVISLSLPEVKTAPFFMLSQSLNGVILTVRKNHRHMKWEKPKDYMNLEAVGKTHTETHTLTYEKYQ